MAEQNFDPWTWALTIHDLAADEVISALQKEIRRGNEENSAMLAYEMVATSPELERKLWDRLAVISVEDIGFGEGNVPLYSCPGGIVTPFRRWRGRLCALCHSCRALPRHAAKRSQQ